jgi:hypothetical protein
MTRVALNAPRTKIVPVDSIEAWWLYPNEAAAREAMAEAAKHPKMQALMEKAEAKRLEEERTAAERAAAEAAPRRRAVEVK